MGILLLSTLDRVRRAANKTGSVSQDDAMLLSALASASQAMQSYCSLQWHRSPKSESIECNASGITKLGARPVASITSVSLMPSGSLGKITLPPDRYAVIGENELHYPMGMGPLDRLIVDYVGGIAVSTTVSTENVVSFSGAPAVGDSFTSSSAIGSFISLDQTSMTAQISVSDGTLTAGDILSGPVSNQWSILLGETVIPSIISDYCDLANACDQQTLYIYQRRNAPGRKVVVSGNGGGTTFEDAYQLLPGVKEVLEYYDPQILA